MSESQSFVPRRSCLYMPGANERALEKAKSLDADVVIFDLEDAVSPEAKEQARQSVVSAVESKAYGYRQVVVRINGLDTEWGREDLQASMQAGPDAILVPKITTADDIYQLSAAMDSVTERLASEEGVTDVKSTQLWVMIEMPEAILNIREIAAAAASTRLEAFVMGTNDLAKETYSSFSPQREAFHYALSVSVMAARANGLLAIDGVFNDIGDADGFLGECQQGRMLGFDGKSLIHPKQLEVANTVYAPDEDEYQQSLAVINAFAQVENKDKGVIKVNGKMTERLHLQMAERVVAIRQAIDSRQC